MTTPRFLSLLSLTFSGGLWSCTTDLPIGSRSDSAEVSGDLGSLWECENEVQAQDPSQGAEWIAETEVEPRCFGECPAVEQTLELDIPERIAEILPMADGGVVLRFGMDFGRGVADGRLEVVDDDDSATGFLLRLAADGSTLWRLAIKGMQGSSTMTSTPENQVLLATEVTHGETSRLILARFSNSGELEKSREFDVSSSPSQLTLLGHDDYVFSIYGYQGDIEIDGHLVARMSLVHINSELEVTGAHEVSDGYVEQILGSDQGALILGGTITFPAAGDPLQGQGIGPESVTQWATFGAATQLSPRLPLEATLNLSDYYMSRHFAFRDAAGAPSIFSCEAPITEDEPVGCGMVLRRIGADGEWAEPRGIGLRPLLVDQVVAYGSNLVGVTSLLQETAAGNDTAEPGHGLAGFRPEDGSLSWFDRGNAGEFIAVDARNRIVVAGNRGYEETKICEMRNGESRPYQVRRYQPWIRWMSPE